MTASSVMSAYYGEYYVRDECIRSVDADRGRDVSARCRYLPFALLPRLRRNGASLVCGNIGKRGGNMRRDAREDVTPVERCKKKCSSYRIHKCFHSTKFGIAKECEEKKLIMNNHNYNILFYGSRRD